MTMNVAQKLWHGAFDHSIEHDLGTYYVVNSSIFLAKTVLSAAAGWKIASILKIRPSLLGGVSAFVAFTGIANVLIIVRAAGPCPDSANQRKKWEKNPWVRFSLWDHLSRLGLLSVAVGVFQGFSLRACLNVANQIRNLAHHLSLGGSLRAFSLGVMNGTTFGVGLLVTSLGCLNKLWCAPEDSKDVC